MCTEISSFLSPRLLRFKNESEFCLPGYCKFSVNVTLNVRSICTPPRSQQYNKPQNLLEIPQNEDYFWSESPRRPIDFDEDLKPMQRSRLLSVDTPLRKPWLKDGVPESMNDLIVGQGGFGIVVKALYKGKEVAVKVVKRHRRASLKSLDNERNAVKLKHPNLVYTSRVVNEDKHLFGLVLMENCPSMSLQQIIDDANFEISRETRLRYLIDISEALSYCHAHGVIHLDVKPRNVLVLLNKNQSKLCDFGMSRRIDSNFDLNDEYSGTIAYSAPELFRRQKQTIKCDVYSYGILMWQLQTRETPYAGLARDAVIYKVVSQNLRPLSMRINTFENEYASAYEHCWRTHPSDRPTIHEVALQLRAMFKKVKKKIRNGFQVHTQELKINLGYHHENKFRPKLYVQNFISNIKKIQVT